MQFTKESQLYLPIVRGALEEGWPLWRVQDGSPGMKPFDITGCTPDGRAVGLEVKLYCRHLKPDDLFPWGPFERQQSSWLKAFTRCSAVAIAVVCERDKTRTFAYRLYREDFVVDRKICDISRFELQLDFGRGTLYGWNRFLAET